MNINVEGYLKKYGQTIGVKDLNFTVNSGSFTGFIGPNGAGKSTTIRLLMDLLKPDGGHAFIGGYNCQDSGDILKNDIGYLPSEINLYKDANAKTLIDLVISLRCDVHRRLDRNPLALKETMVSNGKELVERLKINTSKPFGQLSLGNQKKVGILLCLLHDPKVLIMDEATSGLDPLIQDVFFELIKEAHKRGTTILFSSHVLSEVSRLCDDVLIIRDGSVIAEEKIKALRQKQLKNIAIQYNPSEIEGIKYNLNQNSHALVESLLPDQCVFQWQGDYDELLALLSKMPLRDINIYNPSLETIFKHYYKDADATGSLGVNK